MIVIIAIAFVFSFLGSIPPGAINLSVLQLSVEGHFKAALRFAIAAAIVEFPYAFLAVKFQAYLLSSPIIIDNIKLIAAVVMLLLGFINLYNSKNTNTNRTLERLKQSGFRKGIIISILNPLAIPFWVGVTAYLDGIGWVSLQQSKEILIYVSGISLGTFALLFLVALLGNKISSLLNTDSWMVRYIPGIVYILLGLYALTQFFNLF